ncbi:diaminopropionate ammonia-lyase [Clostridium cochlearium]|uniref:L-threonine ammonia-lyase n=1 Tax=Clostridium cochlearium TaxID=1494 RepID=A0ABY0QMY8_CLOCO|nr:diaminopropionate ammonia-lyase [Clostridium cochlearium]MBV1819761.1 diaminopropionate ammonia-lyase [Bacteroidales bacterium MSK.15.36]NSJ92557.1 diaminopropionate ammonia-lyase [Coprococcus sp. MSK.21.13]MCG4572292.1 diaminopropionate ammonia-lyase [Clostridium cochlearium]MCG4581258.1 diaminopropionate ammonia-lyase [Clostridium cochlearium]MCR1972459.1 diaminopropionate ammonia-lyase [Clostridium cochlearium]
MIQEKLIEYILNDKARNKYIEKTDITFISDELISKVRKFHKSFPEYKVTPLHKLDNLAKYLGVESIFLKDESYRFGLNAFKVLGGAYAIGKFLAERLGLDIMEMSFEKLRTRKVKEKLGNITFVTATDGNHGRGIAWAANKLGQKSVVYMPKGSSPIRLENIKKEGAEATIIDGNYDDAVRLADKMAKEHGWVVIQDTAWEGYEDIPTWIMQGYGTLIHESIEQLEEFALNKPTHVFLQAGVGSFAAAVQGYLASKFGEERPITIIVEPNDAACIYKSAKINDGKPHIVTGNMPTIMAGLACGEPNIIGWEILRDYSDGYLSCPDYVSARGMRILASPLKGDNQIISGESGAVGVGAISLIMERDCYKELREKLGLNKDSKILLISTEGDTDPDKYKDIVWDGDNSSII